MLKLNSNDQIKLGKPLKGTGSQLFAVEYCAKNPESFESCKPMKLPLVVYVYVAKTHCLLLI